MPEVNIRSTVATDLNILMALDHTCQSEYVWQMDVQREETQTAVLFREIRLPRNVVVTYPRRIDNLAETWKRNSGMLTAMIEESIVGYIRVNDTTFPHSALITDVVVSPRYRRQGIASALILAVRNWAKNRQMNRVLIEMTTKNVPAIRLAQKLGFEFCGYNDTYFETQDIALFFKRSIV